MSNNVEQRPAASDQAYDRTPHDIVNGVLKEHEHLTEQALAKRLGLSRTPIREAARSPRETALLTVAADVGLVAKTYPLYSEQALTRGCQQHHVLVDAIASLSPQWARSVMSPLILAAQATVQEYIADEECNSVVVTQKDVG